MSQAKEMPGSVHQSLNICLVTETIRGIGGVELVVRELAADLVRRGHKVTVLTLDREAACEAQYEQGYKHIQLRSLPTDRYVKRSGRSLLYAGFWLALCFKNSRLVDQIIRWIEDHEPDVIHTHKIRGYPLNLWQRIRAVHRGRLVHTCHDIELLSPRQSIPQLANVLNPLARGSLHFWRTLSRSDSTAVDVVSAPSEFMLGLHLEAGFFNQVPAKVIPNFAGLADSFALTPMREISGDERVRLLFVGRLVEVKGIELLCRAVIQHNRSATGFCLRVAGDGPLREKVRAYSDRHEFIDYVGMALGPEKEALFHWADVVATPSICDEAFCIAAAEALSAGRPVLAGKRGALPELVEDGVTGWIFSGEDAHDIELGLRRIERDKSNLSEFSERCSVAAHRFSRPRVMRRYEDIFRR